MTTSTRRNVLLIGGGGREHALAEGLAASPTTGELFITHPGNPGLAALGTPVDVPVDAKALYRLEQFCDRHDVGLVVIGPEDPLADGFADTLRTPNRAVFGPDRAGARLEADKAWCKQLLKSASVPQGDGRVFTDAEAALRFVETRVADHPALGPFFELAARYPDPEVRRKWIERERDRSPEVSAAYREPVDDLPVIKAAGLAKGKGVTVPNSLEEALAAIESIMIRRVFGSAGDQVLVEERLTGVEASVMAITDGKTLATLPVCQDHKRLRDGDAGPNTGGMGAFTPTGSLSPAQIEEVERDILVPTLDALRREGIDYRGVLYAGLMLTPAGPKVLEFNCRFGDPECQTILPLFEGDLQALLYAAATRTLDDAAFGFRQAASCCVVAAAEGYPGKPASGDVIEGCDAAAGLAGAKVYHAGTTRNASGDVVTSGGRVLSVVATAENASEARANAYDAMARISFRGKHVRTDIASVES